MIVNGLILAAGQSKRVGSIKALLPYKDKNILFYQIEKLKRCINGEVYVVLGAYTSEIIEQIGNICHFIINKDWQKGQIYSLLKGLETVKTDVLMNLVDIPFVELNTYFQILNKGIECNKLIIPSYNKNAGHPIYIPYKYYNVIYELCKERGLRELRNKRKDLIHYLEVNDNKILIDIDTVDDYLNGIKLF